MMFIILLFLFNFDQYILEPSSSTCYPERPIRSKDNKCTNFDDICLKQDDADCNNFKSECKQCPATNYSILMFMDILSIKSQLQINKRETAHINKMQNDIFILLWIVIVILVICFVLLICVMKFKLFSKLFNVQSIKNQYEYLNSRNCELSQEKSSAENYTLMNNFQKFIDSLAQLETNKRETDQKMELKMNEIFIKMKKLLEPISTKTKFKIEGYEELFNVNFGEEETIVKIKKNLCEKISKNLKKMKMKLNGRVLDDNNILSTAIGILNDYVVIDCYFDNEINASEIIVLNVGCKNMNPKLIQIRKNQTIEDLKNILSRFDITTNFIILKGATKLDDKKSINDLQLIDNDMLTVIQIETKQLKVSSVFDNETTVRIDYSTINKVENLKQYIAHKNSSDPSFYVLFIGNICLNEDKYVYEYDIENESSVQYCCIKKLNGMKIGQRLHKGKIAELFSATDKDSNKEMLLLKYEVLSESNMKENKHIIKELKVFQIVKLHERFVKLLDIFHKDKIVYVAMENMSQSTVKMYMEKHSPLNLKLIQRWSLQILEGLQHLHNHELILRDLNPNHILVDKDDNVKLYSFNVSKYKEYHNPSSLSIDENSPGFLARYFAPEIFLHEPCGKGTDIWSLGAVLIKLATGKSPFDQLSKYEIINEYRKSKYIEYELPTSNNYWLLKEFIDSCLKPLENRATITQLKNHGFIRNI